MKRLLHGSLSLLALALAFHLGAATSESGYVDHMSTGIVSLDPHYSQTAKLLDENGIVWSVDLPGVWTQVAQSAVPVQVSDIKFWAMHVVVTLDDQVWIEQGGEWHYAGQWPNGSSAAQKTSWGSLKAQYR